MTLKKKLLPSTLFTLSTLIITPACLAQSDSAGCAALGIGFLFTTGVLVLWIALLVWTSRDMKARNVDNSGLWLVLVFFTGIFGFIAYLLIRPQGNLVPCSTCRKNKMPDSPYCPHCGMNT